MDTINLINKIKHNRTQYSFLIDMVTVMSIKNQSKYEKRVFYEYGGRIVLEHDLYDGRIYADYVLIWNAIQLKSNYSYHETEDIILSIISRYTEINIHSAAPHESAEQGLWACLYQSIE